MSSVLPNNILKCLSAADRKSLGRAGLTAEEALQRAEVKCERDLQGQIVALLRLKGIEPIVSAMNKRTTNNLGTPDILFSTCSDFLGTTDYLPCAWEVKFGKRERSREQLQMAVKMTTPPNGWRYRVIRSVDEALTQLKQMGLA